MEMSAVDNVWQSDQMIPNQIKQTLITSVYLLENLPEKNKGLASWSELTNF